MSACRCENGASLWMSLAKGLYRNPEPEWYREKVTSRKGTWSSHFKEASKIESIASHTFLVCPSKYFHYCPVLPSLL